MIWRTEDGNEFCAVVPLYGRLVDSAGEAYRIACEARFILDKPLDWNGRLRDMEKRAERRSSGDAGIAAKLLADLKDAVKREWEWRKAQRAAA